MVAGLTVEILDRLMATVVPEPDQGVNLWVGIIEVPTKRKAARWGFTLIPHEAVSAPAVT